MGSYQIVDGPIIIGGGPSGLAVSACLKENGVPSIILERNDCIASLWQQKTYDRLKLHLPKNFSEIPLMGFPSTFPKYPSKNQFISYLESYAAHFSINPIFNQLVLSAHRDSDTGLWTVRTKDCCYVSRWLVVATGENADPLLPDIHGLERFKGNVVHASEYRSGYDYRNQRVLVVGCGNSGMEISLDLCNYNVTPHIVVRNSVHILPREMFGISTFEISMTLLKWMPLWVVDKFLVTVANFTLGNTAKFGIRRPKAGPLHLKNVTGKTPVLDAGALSEIKAGKIKLTGGIKEITENGAKFMAGKEMEFDSIILATGYKSNVPNWLQGSDFFTRDGMPKIPFPHGWKGENGLYTVGFTRRGIMGITSDAVNIGRDIAGRYSRV